jgi:hypothetical protein
MTNRIEEVILSSLVDDIEFCRKTLPFLEDSYFTEFSEKMVFSYIRDFFQEYAKPPNVQILKIKLEDEKNISQSNYDSTTNLIEGLKSDKSLDSVWLLERTEKFCKDQALYNSIMESISILDGNNTKFNKDAIPSLLQQALSVSFDKQIGHDFFADSDSRYDFYHLETERLPFKLDLFNKITKGGLPKKTFNLVLAGCVHPTTKVKLRVRLKE